MDAVLVTHNSAPDLESLRGYATIFDRVIVADNASTDGTPQLARAMGFELLEMNGNKGFAAAANAGAARTTTPVFCVLNPDVIVDDRQDLDALSTHFIDQQVAAVAPALRLPNGSRQDSARRIPTLADLVVRRVTNVKPDAVWSAVPLDVEWVVGACMIFRRTAFDAVGGFDEGFFLYFEDVELCLRLRMHGYRVRYDPTRVIRHEHGAASRQPLTHRATQHHMRSALRFYARHPRHAVVWTRRAGSALAVRTRREAGRA